ncbi:MAG: hypothetical protein NZ903_00185 [Candidatus Micrarchaeota archaeon]|nr:hypothetical protein [Candidatus Micrarchaeota archaeon]
MAKERIESIGAFAFYFGIFIAFLFAILPIEIPAEILVIALTVLGIVVGIVNIGDKELSFYLLANITFLIAADIFSDVLLKLPIVTKGFFAGGGIVFLQTFLQNIILFVSPGVAIVALKIIYDAAK